MVTDNTINWSALEQYWADEIEIENAMRTQFEVKTFEYPYN